MNLLKLKSINWNYETALAWLVFLFPLFAIEVRHWDSHISATIALLSMFYYFIHIRRQKPDYHIYERWYLRIFVIYFVIFLISMLAHYPEKFSNTRFDIELRVLYMIPMYYLFSISKDTFKYLAAGCAVAIVIAFAYCIYEVFIMSNPYLIEGIPFFRGEYSQLFAGPVLLLFLTVFLGYIIPEEKIKKNLKFIVTISIVLLASISILYTTVRVAFVTYFILAIMFVFFYMRGWKKIVALLLVASFIPVSLSISESMKARFEKAVRNLESYETIRKSPESEQLMYKSSLGVRLEILRSGQYFLKDYYLIGVGNGNYIPALKKYVDQGDIHPAALEHGHPHNVFLNALITKGVPGLLAVLAIYFFPLYVYIKTRKISKYTAYTGILFISAMTLFSMNEVAPFYKSNFISINLIMGLILFLTHMRQVKKHIR